LLSLFDPEPDTAVAMAMEVLEDFPRVFESYWLAGMRKKLGLRTEEAGDPDLIQSLLDWMEISRADFTNTFRDLSESHPPVGERYQDEEFQTWYSRWTDRVGQAGLADAMAVMRSVNPAVIPRNHRVEEALAAAEEHDDLGPLDRLVEALAAPFEARSDLSEYRDPPIDEDGYRTFCGT
jgi:serine/tyrosine/threonine adenylyltransferase